MNASSENDASPPTARWVRDLGHDANVVSICFFIVLFVFIAFYPSLLNGFVRYDDEEYVTANPMVQRGLTIEGVRWAFSHPVSGNWHPLTLISHMLDCSVFGLKPWGHHLTGLLFHAANAVLVFLVLRRLTGAAGRSLIVSLLFALHPLRVESVAWVAERKDVLSAFFWLLTMWAYARYVGELKVRGSKAKVYYGRALLFFALGLLCKPMLVTLPFALLLLDYWPLNRSAELGRENPPNSAGCKQLLIEKIPFFALAAGACIVTYLVQKQAEAIVSDQSFAARAENALVSYCRYIGKLFWPADLAVMYPYPDHWPAKWVLLAGLALIGVSYFVVRSRRQRPYLPVGWFWYLGTLVPVIGLVQVGAQSMADRYTYIPIIGLLIIIVWGLHDLTQSWQCQGTASAIACGLVSLVCISLTHRQLGYWMDCERLFRHTLAVTENNTIAHNNLASALYDTGHPDEAIAELKEALSLSPQSPGIHYNLGLALAKSGQVDDAIKQFHIALKISPQSPFYHNDLANAFVIKGDLDDAIREYQEAIRLNPLQPDFHNNLGVTLLKKGRWDDAIHECQEALRLSPGFEKARIALANALNQKKASQPGGM